MSEIKFHKAEDLPNPLNSTHDGVWFTEGTKGAFKIFIVSGGVAVPLNYEDAINFSNLTNNVIPKKSPSGNALVDSNIQDTAVGSEVLGRLDSTATLERRTIVTNASSLYTIDLNNPSGHYDIRLTGNTTIVFSNMITAFQSIVITLTVRGNYSLLFPSWLKPMPYNDDYHSSSVVSDLNLITIIIRHGGSSPSGIYSLTNVDIS